MKPADKLIPCRECCSNNVAQELDFKPDSHYNRQNQIRTFPDAIKPTQHLHEALSKRQRQKARQMRLIHSCMNAS